MTAVVAKNQTGSPLSLTQLLAPNSQIPGSGQVTLSDWNKIYEILEDPQLLGYINDDSVLLAVDGVDFTKNQSLAFLGAPVASKKNNLSASSNPTTSNDETQGYSVGSMWANTDTNESYICLDASQGAAVWKTSTGVASHGSSHLPGAPDAIALLSFANEVHVDGTNGNDSWAGTVFAPKKTIMGAVSAASSDDVIIVHTGSYPENVVIPADVHLQGNLAVIAPASGTAVKVVPGTKEPDVGITIIRGLAMAGSGTGYWALEVVGDADTWTSVFVSDSAVDSSDYAGQISVVDGMCMLADNTGGSSTDGTGTTGLKMRTSLSADGSFVQLSECSLAATGYLIDIGFGCVLFADGTRFETIGENAVVAKVAAGAEEFAMLNLRNPDIRPFGQAGKSVLEMSGNGVTVSISFVAPNVPMQDLTGDLFVISGGSLVLEYGRWGSTGGRGLVMTGGQVSVRNCAFKTTGKAVDLSAGVLRSQNSDFGPQTWYPTTDHRVVLSGGTAYLDSGSIEDNGNTYDALQITNAGATVWMTGGIDLIAGGDANAVNATNGTVHRGHANIRSGAYVIGGSATEVIESSGFGRFRIGPAGSQIDIASVVTLPGPGEGFGTGSLVVMPNDTRYYQLYHNVDTDEDPTWVPFPFPWGAPPDHITVTQDYEADFVMFIHVDASSRPVTITLPLPDDTVRGYYIKKIDSTRNAVTIKCVGAATIDGHDSVVLRTPQMCIPVVPGDVNCWSIV